MDAPPDAQSVRKLDGHIEITRVALGVAGGFGQAGVRGRVNRGAKGNPSDPHRDRTTEMPFLREGWQLESLRCLFAENLFAYRLSGIGLSLPATRC